MSLELLQGGFLTTVQDLGRWGYQQFGVSVSGAMDARSATLANILVGNQPEDPLLEITILGPEIRFHQETSIALTGGNLSPTLNGYSIPLYQEYPVFPNDILRFGAVTSGCRCYLAVSGGLDVPLVMGSSSTFLRGNMGGFHGRKLEKGDHIPLNSQSSPLAHWRTLPLEDFSSSEKTLRVVMGPQNDAFTDEGISTFLSEPYTITPENDRMGCRLHGKTITHKEDSNIISDGIVFGSVQIPDNGTPIIMLADCQTTGGYTKIATVISVDLPLIAQSKTGDILRFQAISVEESQQLACNWAKNQKFYTERVQKPPTEPEQPPLPKEIVEAVILQGQGEYSVLVDEEIYHCSVQAIRDTSIT